jgi:tetratricopeptide (TPR) repeat protein
MAEGRVGRHELFLPELDNVRAVLEWLVAVDEIELGLGLALRLENFWVTTDPVEGRRWIGELFERRRELPPDLRAWTLRALGGATYVLGDFAEGHRYMGEAQAVYEELGDSAAIAHMGTREAVEASRTGDLVRARELCERSLALDSRPFNAAQVSRILGGIAYREGQADEAIELVDRAASQAAEIGFRWWQAGSLLQAAEIALTSGRADDVRLRLLTALPVAHGIGDRQMSCYGLALLAWVTADAGDAQAAGVFWGAAEAEAERGSFDPLVDDRAVYEPHVSVVAGPEFENGVRTGRAMSLDDAVAYALGP